MFSVLQCPIHSTDVILIYTAVPQSSVQDTWIFYQVVIYWGSTDNKMKENLSVSFSANDSLIEELDAIASYVTKCYETIIDSSARSF